MPEAKQLVQEKRFNEAILILSDIIRTNPERMDEAEKLLSDVRAARDKYNNLYSELIDLYQQEDLDLDEAYRIFKELENVDKDPNDSMASSFADAKEAVVFIYNNKTYKKIMNDALVLLDQKKYWEAIDLYLTGFQLHRESFDKNEYGNIVVGSIDEKISNIKKIAANYKNLKTSFQKSVELLISYTENNSFYTTNTYYSELEKRLKEIASFKSDLKYIASTLEIEQKLLQADDGLDIPFLSTINRLTVGREGQNDGISGAIKRYWEDIFIHFENYITENVQKEFNIAVTSYNRKEWIAADSAFKKSYNNSMKLIKYINLWGLLLNSDENNNPDAYFRAQVDKHYPEYLYVQSLADSSRIYIKTIDNLKNVYNLENQIKNTNEAQLLVNVRSNLTKYVTDLGEQSNYWEKRNAYYTSVYDLGVNVSKTVNYSSSFLDIVKSAHSRAESTEIAAADKIYNLRISPVENIFNNEFNRIADSQIKINGIRDEGDSAAANILRKYPTEAREQLISARENIGKSLSMLEDVNDDFDEERALFSRTPEYEVLDQKFTNIRSKINDLGSRIPGLIKTADELIFNANRNRNEGYLRLREAETAYNNNEFDTARQKLQDSTDKFLASFTYEDSPAIRAETDERIRTLSERIIEAENKIVIVRVREDINAGKTFYAQGDYLKAENVLIRADTTWKTTHQEANQEVDYWLRFVRTALSLKTGRDIEETDPLFTEMTQFLNRAREDYLKARDLYASKKTEEAFKLLDNAQEKLLYVNIAFPRNQEASVLSLRILQIKDEKNFESFFQQKFNEAENKISSNPQEAYIDLKDLEQIQSDYPGLQRAIYRAEIKLGIKAPPPDKTKLKKADDLYTKAYKIVSGNNRGQYKIALAYLNDAFNLNPESSKIIELKDRLQAEIGGTTTVTLSIADQKLYRSAEELFIQGKYFQAMNIVQKLLSNDKNKRYSPLLELEARIRSKI